MARSTVPVLVVFSFFASSAFAPRPGSAQTTSLSASPPAAATQPAATQPAATQSVAPRPAAGARPSAPKVRLIYSGGTGGLRSVSATGSTILLLWDALTRRGGSTRIDLSGMGVLRRGQRLLLEPRRLRATDMLAFLKRTQFVSTT